MTFEFSSIPSGSKKEVREDFSINNIEKIVFYIFRWRIQPDFKLYLYIFLTFTTIPNSYEQRSNNAVSILGSIGVSG